MRDTAPGLHPPRLLAGLVGRALGLSRTPAMHVAEAARQGMRAEYRLFDLDETGTADLTLGDVLDRAEAEGFDGLNVTHPFKIEVLSHLDAVSDEARTLGAVNTVVFEGGRRMGHNTDLWGFAESFRQGLPDAATSHVLLLGAGGAGVAVAHALARCGVRRLSIRDIDPDRAQALAATLAEACPRLRVAPVIDIPWLFDEDRPDGVVNATPVGMAKLPGTAIDTSLLTPDQWVADIVYMPLETELLAEARARGCRVLPGSGMAVFQAVRAFELFTGRLASPDHMRAAFDACADQPAASRAPSASTLLSRL